MPKANDILVNKVLKVQTKLTRRIKNRLPKVSKQTQQQLNSMGMLSITRTVTFLAAALGDKKARTVEEMETRLKLAPTNGTSYRAIKTGLVTGVVKKVDGCKYQLTV